jgi:RND family efflux transporter MFP subunit
MIVAAIMALLVGLLAACSSKSKEPAAQASAKDAGAQPVLVSTAAVVERNTNRGIEVVGSLDAEEEVTVSSQGSGILESISVDLGSAVTRGQVLARIDQRELRLKLDQAEAALRQAEARLGVNRNERVDPQRQPDVRQAFAALERARYDLTAAKKLFDAGTISNQQYDVYQKTVEQAEARYQAALENVRNLEALVEEKLAAVNLTKKQLADSEIISPITGIVKQRSASRGEYMQPGKAVVTVVQINPLRLRLEVPETFAASIARGQVVTLRIDSFADREFKGVIKRINPSMDEKNRSLIAEAEVANPNALLRPGMFARAQIRSDAQTTALMVPEKAVVSLAGVNKVFVVEGDHAVERMVKLGARDGSLVEILEGIKSGERVITSNIEQLHNGVSVSAS